MASLYLTAMTLSKMQRWILAGTLALLGACGAQSEAQSEPQASPTVTVVGDTTFLELPLGRPADNGELSVTFDGVTEDSRCPSDVQCVWQGNAGIRLTLASGGRTEVFILNSTVDPRLVSFAGYTIGYRDLSPYPVVTTTTDRSASSATIWIVDTR